MLKKIITILMSVFLMATVLPDTIYAEEETGDQEEITEITEEENPGEETEAFEDETETEEIISETEEPVIEDTAVPEETEEATEAEQEEVIEEPEEESDTADEEVIPEEITEEPVEETVSEEEDDESEEVIEETDEEIIREPEEPVIEETAVPEDTEEITETEQEEVIEEVPAEEATEETVVEETPEPETSEEIIPESEEESAEEGTDVQPDEGAIEEPAEETTETEATDDVYGDYEYTSDGSAITITGYTGSAITISIPSKINGLPVRKIGDDAFNGCSWLTSITIPNGVTNIGSNSFRGCTNLSKITIPETVTSFVGGSLPFSGCSSLKTAGPVGSGSNYEFGWTESIPATAFRGCELTSITIPNGIKRIGQYAFEYCRFSTITIPNTVTSIGLGAFQDCSSMKSIQLSDNLVSVEDYLFKSCNELASITIPSSVTSIGEDAFEYCYKLNKVTISSGVTSIGKGAFSTCNKLTNIEIPDSVTSIGAAAFSSCWNLTSITLPNGLTQIEGDTFNSCNSLQTVSIPESVTSIGQCAFSDCKSLTGITIPNAVTNIDERAFRNCTGLTSITIPASVSSIGEYALGYTWSSNVYSLMSGFTIKGSSGSAAETYAKNNGISFISINRPLSNATFSSIPAKTYTGSAIKPALSIIDDGTTLKAGTDYTVSYKNNINAGTASVTITGKGIYTGTVTKTFTINPKKITAATLGTTAYTYDGKAKTPGVTVNDGDKTLTKGTDYTVSYPSGRINAGTYTVTVTMKGNYTGTIKAPFTIKKASQSVTAKAAAASVSVGKTTTLTVTGNKGTLSYASANTAVATVSSAGKITAKKVGTVKITVTSAATTNYNKAVKTITIKVVPAATAKVTAANKAGGIKIAWKAVTGATGYKIYRNGSLAKTITSGSTLSWGDTKATANGEKYTYKVVATASTGDSKLSKSVVIYRVSQPKITSLKNSSAGKIAVKWGKNTSATGYQLQYSTSSKFTASATKTITITSATTIAKTINSLKEGTKYYVRIRAYKTVSGKKYYSLWSAVKNKTTAGWKKVSGKWYYYDTNGDKATGWKKISGDYYYFNTSGSMAVSKWVGRYYVNSSGKRSKTQTDEQYYVRLFKEYIGSGSASNPFDPDKTKWMSKSKNYKYYVYDIDKNGKKEFIVTGEMTDGSNNVNHAVYTLDKNDTVKKVTGVTYVSAKGSLVIYNNGVITMYTAPSAANYDRYIYTYKGNKLTEKEHYQTTKNTYISHPTEPIKKKSGEYVGFTEMNLETQAVVGTAISQKLKSISK